jgi:hypothetical protein
VTDMKRPATVGTRGPETQDIAEIATHMVPTPCDAHSQQAARYAPRPSAIPSAGVGAVFRMPGAGIAGARPWDRCDGY